jgi:lysophospholipase L1-like esterase
MKLFDRRRLINALLIVSLLLNVAIVGYLARSGGLRRIFLKLDLAELPRTREAFQKDMEARYGKYPGTPAEIVFAGDSLVADGPWAELLSEVHNRGIGGETTSGMLTRLHEVIKAKPVRLFLLLGTNDLAMAVPEAQILRNYRKLLEQLRQESPKTVVTVIAILPINPNFPKVPTQSNADIASVNRGLKALVSEFPGVGFLDLTSHVADESGNLRRDFSVDGIHMNIDGYLAIRKPIGEALTR